jgi:N-acetylmuramic acid 6-phosphate (MurNAc-6-P) etherase
MAELRLERKVRRVAREPGAGDAVLDDVEGLDHHAHDAEARVALVRPLVDDQLGFERRQIGAVLDDGGAAEQVEIGVDIMIDVPVGPEVIMGSTRMKSATAQKMVLNMITTGAMIRLGKVYENVMVDLMLTNNKLKERAKRIIMFLAEISYKEAETLLDEADGHVKTALMIALTGFDKEKCQKLLDENDGFIRKALEQS